MCRINAEANEDAIFKIYECLNSGSVELTEHQVRKAVYGGPYIDLCEELAGHPSLLAIRRAENKDKMETDREWILRFFALRWDDTRGVAARVRE